MGSCFSKKNQHSIIMNPQNSQNTKVKQKDTEFNFSMSDLVTEKFGKVNQQYIILAPPLGKGAFGEVRKAQHRMTKQMRAIKIIHKEQQSQEDQQRLINEVEMLRKLDHPNIIQVYEFYQDAENFYIITELCTGGELFDSILAAGHYNEHRAAKVIKQILSAVSYCHQNNIVHRDLKPENCLLESNNTESLIKVIDFGTSQVFDQKQRMKQKYGTPYYIAPEVINKNYDEKCDVWSAGVILYILLVGYPPFNGQNDKEIMKKVVDGDYDIEGDEWDYISQEAKNLITKMLTYDSRKRVSALQALQDPWVVKYSKESSDQTFLNSTLNNLNKFKKTKKLQDAAFIFMVNYLATKEDKQSLLKTFQQLDENSDGVLSRQELVNGYKHILKVPNPEEQVDKILELVDKNKSGYIDYTEFVMATIDKSKILTTQKLELVFQMIDTDGSGKISIKEFKNTFGGANASEEVWTQIVKEVDDNGDGEVSLEEFKQMMLEMVNNV